PPGAPLTDLRQAQGGRCGHGREFRPRECPVVCAGGRRADRDPDLSALGSLPRRAGRMSGGPPDGRPLRDHQLRQVRGRRARSSRELVQHLVRDDLSASAFRLFQVTETAVGFALAILTRAGFTGELGYEIWTTPDYFSSLYDDLWDAGRKLGLVHFGGRALSSLRL